MISCLSNAVWTHSHKKIYQVSNLFSDYQCELCKSQSTCSHFAVLIEFWIIFGETFPIALYFKNLEQPFEFPYYPPLNSILLFALLITSCLSGLSITTTTVSSIKPINKEVLQFCHPLSFHYLLRISLKLHALSTLMINQQLPLSFHRQSSQ